ncbi:hypothetical protein UlMin_000003 [Ulmus minor]
MEAIRCEGQEHIEHFSHQHPMPVVEIDPQHHIQCFACQSLCSGPAYACRACEYFLHKSCADLPREIQQHHDHSFHPLFLPSDNYCHQPKASDDLHHLTNSVFLCLNCDFKIHFICGPLPSTIKHECHIHPLILVGSIDANFEEYYCDVCEFQRNPRTRVYYCKDCQYIAHPHYVTSEVIFLFFYFFSQVIINMI